ncbi:MAG: hypothetical protein HZC28_08690 [Spirochaetes bacterium]|nr:hypothetical protein [Spirochaetota bacterium]
MRILIVVFAVIYGAFAGSIYEGEFPPGMKAAVFNETHLRRAPRDDAGTVIRAVQAGTMLTIVEKSNSIMSNGDISSAWYRVTVNDGGRESSGYIWGGHIALTSVRRGADIIVIGLTAFAKGDFDAECRLVRGGRIISRLVFRPHYSDSGDPGSYYYSLTASLSGNRGVDGIENMIDVHCWFPATDYPYGHIWIGIAKDTLYSVARDTSFEESGVKRNLRWFIFPGDPTGERGIITLVDVRSVFDGKAGDFTMKSSNRFPFRWQNNTLVPVTK